MRIFYLLIAFAICSLSAAAQGTTGFSGTGGNIDVDNYQIYGKIDPDSVRAGDKIPNISGIIKVKFKTTVANVTKISFDLRNDSHVIDNIVSNLGTVLPTWTGNTFSVPVNIPLKGTRDSITITYHGEPPGPSGAATGFTVGTNSGAGTYVGTLSEFYEDRDWWPCKADMQDKADTIDITVKVPWLKRNATDTFWVASNGTLIDSAINTVDKSRTFKYINRYPMASYLVCLGIARFNRYYRGTIPIGGYNVPVVYYILAGKSATNSITAMDKATEMVAKFSTLFGDYGFPDPAKGGKHGFYEGLVGAGGMEHQTFSAIAPNYTTNRDVLVHELMHQWFGDKVSFSTWRDLWLAEGFAEYAPLLARQMISGMSSTALAYRTNLRDNSRTELAPVQIPQSGIINSDAIWNSGDCATCYGTSVYQRGAMVVSMLRTLCGDSAFFKIMRQYQTTYGYKSANTSNISSLFSSMLGQDVSKFFTDNVAGTGYPVTTVGYRVYGTGSKTIALKVLSQSTVNSGSAKISQPVVVRIQYKNPSSVILNDTTVVFYDYGDNTYSKAGNGLGARQIGAVVYNLSFMPNTYVFDDSLKTNADGAFSQSSTVVDLSIVDFTAKQHAGYNETTLLLDDNTINAEVILERAADGTNFTDLGNMQLWAGSSSPKKYVYNDMQPLKADNYYRAKYKNADGIFIYSKIVKIGGAKAGSITLVNNPVGDVLQLKASGEMLNKMASVTIVDAASKTIFVHRYNNLAAFTEIPVTALARGVYFIRIAAQTGDAQNIKFIKQ